MPTIKEIAELTGVSPSTVSNVINGKHDKMKPETLELVQNALKEHKYVSNMAGRLLAKNGSKLIGVIMTYTRENEQNAVQDPFFSELIGALEREIRWRGYFMILYTGTSASESLRMASSWNIEGMILQGCVPKDCNKYMESNIPVVFIDAYDENEDEEIVNVGLQDYRGGSLMAEHLIKCGHRKVAFLADEEELMGVDLQRLNGCIDAFNKAGIPFSREKNFFNFSYERKKRYKFIKNFAMEHLKDFTALFFSSDFYAVDAINVFHDMGIKIPEDISVCGFDGNIFSNVCRPHLTTIKQDVTGKAELAIEKLMRIIKNEHIEEKDSKLPVELISRDSVRCLSER